MSAILTMLRKTSEQQNSQRYSWRGHTQECPIKLAVLVEMKLSEQTPSELDVLMRQAPPRVISTHLPSAVFSDHLVSGSGKFVVIMRNVKDNLVSLYHFYRACVAMGNFRGPWGEFFKLFQSKNLFMGDWLEYNLGWWDYRKLDNVFILNYEDLHMSLPLFVRELAKFCDINIESSDVDRIVAATRFSHMKTNLVGVDDAWPETIYKHHIAGILRRGQVGEWRTYFTDEQSAIVDTQYTARAALVGMTFDTGFSP